MAANFQSWLQRIAALCIILMMQGPAIMTQEIAWVKMLVTYTQQRGLKRGVIETFDGKHPCALCTKAAEIRKNENPPDPADKPITLLKQLSWAHTILAAPLIVPRSSGHKIDCQATPMLAEFLGRNRDAPDSPPPKVGISPSALHPFA